MDRRRFIKNSVAAGLGSYVYASLPTKSAMAGTQPPLMWINFQGYGGWDQTLMLDPKPGLRSAYLDPATYPNATNIVRAGGISYLQFADFGTATPGTGFFGAYHKNITVFNGVDTGTNNHFNGQMVSSSGSFVSGTPCFMAQVAGVVGPSMPLAFIDCGESYAGAANLTSPVSLNRFMSTFTNATVLNNNYLDSTNLSAVEAANLARLQRQAKAANLPKDQLEINRLLQARKSQGSVLNLAIPDLPPVPPGTNLNPSLMQLILFARDAYNAGLSVSVNFADVALNFDSHALNEATQYSTMKTYTDYLTWMMGVLSTTPAVIVCTSDFGRTPDHDPASNGGTGHWPIETIFVVQTAAALGKTTLPGDITIGASDANLGALPIDPKTFTQSSTGTILTPSTVYSALRRVAGIANSPALASFPF